MKKTFKQFLTERKNPELNKKLGTFNELKQLKESTDKQLFVSFTDIDKLGINPSSKYDTPIGIYAYTIDYVLEHEINNVPFAGERKFINVFYANGTVLNLSEMELTDDLIQRLKDAYYKLLRKNIDGFERVDIYDMVDSEIHRVSKLHSKPGRIFWYASHNLCTDYYKMIEEIHGSSVHIPAVWNKLMRYANIDGAVDYGDGIIHENEPNQAVFFSTSNIKLLKRIDNNKKEGNNNDQDFKEKIKEIKEFAKRTHDFYTTRTKLLDIFPVKTARKILASIFLSIVQDKDLDNQTKYDIIKRNMFFIKSEIEGNHIIKLPMQLYLQVLNRFPEMRYTFYPLEK